MVTQIAPYTSTSSIFNQVRKNAAKADAASTGTTPTTTSKTSDSDIGSTFMNLLVQELQNQDPTDPMDSTAMVGQMISLNQLDQLVSINQAVGGTATGAVSPSAGGATTARSQAASSQALVTSQLAATPLAFNSNASAAQQLFPS